MVHKTSWSVDEIKERLETADAKTRWTNTQVEALMAQINNHRRNWEPIATNPPTNNVMKHDNTRLIINTT